jgi:hypothetical protein
MCKIFEYRIMLAQPNRLEFSRTRVYRIAQQYKTRFITKTGINWSLDQRVGCNELVRPVRPKPLLWGMGGKGRMIFDNCVSI